MTTLRVILEEFASAPESGPGRYAASLARALVESAPVGCDVHGIVAASPEPRYEAIATKIPGLAGLHKSPLARRELAAAWQHGFTTLPGSGMLHAPSLLAPLARHDRLNRGDQIAVTVHDAIPWSHPELAPGKTAAWARAMMARAVKHADAIVVPTHAVADLLAEHVDLGERVRVITDGPGVAPGATPDDEFGTGYVLAENAGLESDGLATALRAVRAVDGATIVVIGDEERTARLADEVGLDRSRWRSVPDDARRAAVVAGAAALLYPAVASGFPALALDAMTLGVPVIHGNVDSVIEVAVDAGHSVASPDTEAWAGELGQLLADDDARRRLRVLGQDRAKAFTWRSAAEKVWQLHADL